MKVALKQMTRFIAVATISASAVAAYAQSEQWSATPPDKSDAVQRQPDNASRMADERCDRAPDACGPERATGGTAAPIMGGTIGLGDRSESGLVITPDSDLQTNRIGD